MKKRIGIILLAFVMILSLAACSKKEMTETDKAKAAVEGFYKALAELKVSDMKNYVPKAMADEFDESVMTEDEDFEMMKQIFANTSVKYKSGEIEKDATSGKLTFTVNALDFADVFTQMLSLGMLGSEEPDMSAIDWSKIKTKEIDVEISVIKEDDKWVVADPQKAWMNLMDTSALDNLGLDELDSLGNDSVTANDTSVELQGIGTEWVVDGLFKVTIDSVTVVKERNEYSDKNPNQVVMIVYSYENLGYDGDLYITPRSVIDEKGEMCSTYPADITNYPQGTPKGAKMVGAQEAYGLNNESGTIKVIFEEFGNGLDEHKVTFEVPVTK